MLVLVPDGHADVEVVIKNNKPSKKTIISGYRPAFKVKEDYLTTGIVRFINCDKICYGEECTAEVWFFSPKSYPNCLEVGQTIQFQEGSTVTGFVIITKIYNKILERN